jgi:hypothetical protein
VLRPFDACRVRLIRTEEVAAFRLVGEEALSRNGNSRRSIARESKCRGLLGKLAGRKTSWKPYGTPSASGFRERTREDASWKN